LQADLSKLPPEPGLEVVPVDAAEKLPRRGHRNWIHTFDAHKICGLRWMTFCWVLLCAILLLVCLVLGIVLGLTLRGRAAHSSNPR
jgi:hypothetical protein